MTLRGLVGKLHNPCAPRWLDRSIFDHLNQMLDGSSILNVGSGTTRLRADIINLDIEYHPNVDVVADAQCLPFDDGYFDCVFCNAVLEHVPQPWVVAKEISRVTKVGGSVCVQSPFLEAIHDNHDYFRFTLKGLISLFPEFEVIKAGVSGTSNQVLADQVRMFPVLVAEETLLEIPIKFLMGWLAKPLQYLDFLTRSKPSSPSYARAFYFIGGRI